MTTDYSRITKIFRIFAEQRWPSDPQDEVTHHAFEACCKLSDLLDGPQFELFCHLLKRFKKVNYESYVPSLRRALDKFSISQDTGLVFRVAPVLPQKNYGKNKSGPDMVRDFEFNIWRHSPKLRNVPIVAKLVPNDLPVASNQGENTVTIFIDDFVGSGKTVCDFIDEYEKAQRQSKEKIVIITIAAMKVGFDKIKSEGLEIYSDIILNKGIADCPDIADRTQAYHAMDAIENLLSMSASYKHGFGSSEALISLKNTPNNTFPMFWAKEAKGKTPWPSPFPRF